MNPKSKIKSQPRSRPSAKINLSTRQEEQNADDLFSALTVMGASIPKDEVRTPLNPADKARLRKSAKAKLTQKQKSVVAQLKKPKLPQLPSPDLVPKKKIKRRPVVSERRSERRSEFFFRLSESFQQELDRRRKALAKKRVNPALVLLDQEVEERKKVYEQELPEGLQANIERVREFILTEVAPLMMAVQAGTKQAQEVIQRTLNTAIDERPLVQFELMTQSAGRMRMAKFITKYMGLDESVAEELLATVAPKKEMMIFHPGMVDEGRRQKKEKPAPTPKE